MTFQSKLGVYYGDARYVFLFVSKKNALPFLDKNNRRVICTLNNSERFHGALMSDGKGNYFINLNKELRKQLGIGDGDTVEVLLEKDETKYGMELCEELQELLMQDPVFEHYFDGLTPGKCRRLIWIISKPKTSATRLKKAMIISDFLKLNQGKLDLELLNEALKGKLKL